jgi:hypothetical protein
MQYPVIVLSLFSSLALGAPTIRSRQAPSTDAISTAANAWAADTGVVSQFWSGLLTNYGIDQSGARLINLLDFLVKLGILLII